MSDKKKARNRGTAASSVNPQGHGQDVDFPKEPKSELEERAKKSNTKI